MLLAGCARTPEQRRDRFIARGKERLEKKDYLRALLEFRNAAQVMPKDAEPYYQIGMASLASGDARSALVAFRQTLDRDPKHAGAQLAVAQLMIMTGDQEYLKNAQARLKELRQANPNDVKVLNSLALTELKMGNNDTAAVDAEQVLAKAPRELDASVTLAQAKLLERDFQGAEQALKNACEAAPGAPAPRTTLGKFYRTLNRPGEAEAQFQYALQLDAKYAPALVALATLQNAAGRKQEAEQTLKRLSSLPEKTYQPVYGMFLFENGRRDEAIAEFKRLAKQAPDDRAARTRLVTAYIEVGRTADARGILENAISKNSKDADALLQRSEMLRDAGEYNQAEADLNQVMRLMPNSAEVHYLAGKLHGARGATRRQRDELSEAIRLSPYLLPARLELAQALLASKNSRTALELLNSTPPVQKDNVSVRVMSNWAHWSAGDFTAARKGVNEGLARIRHPELLVQDGLLKLRAGDSAAARTSLEEALKLNPSDTRALAALGQSYVAHKQNQQAVDKVKEYVARSAKSAAVQEFLGVLLVSSGDRGGARAAFQAAKAADPKAVQADLSLAQMDTAERNFDSARHRLEEVLARDASNATAHLWLGNLEVAKGDYNSALARFQKVVDQDPNNTQALNNLAYLLAEHRNQPDTALKYAERARELSPEDPDLADTMGWVLYRKGLYRNALPHLELAAARSDVAKYHLAMAYAKTGDQARGRAVLAAALKRNPQLPEAKLAQAVLNGDTK
jgi:tetratricopeptide (TPR) repeat protein